MFLFDKVQHNKLRHRKPQNPSVHPKPFNTMSAYPTLPAVLIDDEARARENLLKILQTFCPQVHIVGQAGSVAEGFSLLNKLRPQLVFLDVEMPDGTGFDLLRLFHELPFRVIFVTAHADYAVQAFRINALDYLLKPVDVAALREALARAENLQSQQQRMQQLLHSGAQSSTVVLPSADGFVFQRIDEIVRLEADDNYTHFYTHSGKHLMVCKSLKEYEEILPSNQFCRVHKSHLVNTTYITRFVNRDGAYLVLQNQDQVPVSKRKKQEFIERFAN